MPGQRKGRPTWIRFSGMGLEFAAAIIGLTLVGYWIGRHYGHGRVGLLIGAGLGIIGGGYNLIRESLLAMKQASRQDDESDSDDSRP